MPNVVLSSVGTSLLTNVAREHRLPASMNEVANAPAAEAVSPEIRAEIEEVLARAAAELRGAGAARAARLSAELNGIVSFYQGRPAPSQDYHILVCTDTWLGEATARLVAEWLRGFGATVEEPQRRSALRTDDLDCFHLALSELVRYCSATFPGYRERGYHVVFNLTGGFKGVQGFLQTLATFYADEAFYIFETGKFEPGKLLRIPRLPIKLDDVPAIREHLRAIRRLALGLPAEPAEVRQIPETFLLRVGDDVTLSEWGELVWEQSRRTIYGEGLHAPPSDRIVFEESFVESVRRLRLAPDRLVELNTRLDKLAQYLERGRQAHLDSLSYKRLKGAPRPGATHEFYAWSDRDAKRVYCRDEGSRVVLLELDQHL